MFLTERLDMRRLLRFKALAAMLAVGSMLPSSCITTTDLRDGVAAGVIDAVSATITDSLTTLFNLPDAVPPLFPTAE